MKQNANSDLLQAALMNDKSACADALERGARIDVQDSNGDTALHVAASWGYSQIARFLLENGASMLVRNNFLITPLHLAAINGKTETFSVLLDWAGKGKEALSKTILDEITFVCSESGTNDKSILDLLTRFQSQKSDKGAGWSRKASLLLIEACMSGDLEKATDVLAHKASPEARDPDGTSVLRLACRKGDDRLVRLLTDHGALVNKKSKTGWTPLMEACAEGHLSIASMLLEKGALTNARTYVNTTALILAARGGFAEIVKLLLDHGADQTIQIKSPAADAGKDAFRVAIEHSHEEIALMIKDFEKEA
jgi:ankyrin repeat protein